MSPFSAILRRRKCQPAILNELTVGSSTATSAGPSVHIEMQPLGMVQHPAPTEASSGESTIRLRFRRTRKKREDAAAKSAKKKSLKDALPERDAVIGGLTLALTAIRDIGDATNIGYMKGLAGLALLIIEVTEGVRTCKSEVQRLTKHIVELINALYNELNSRAEKPSEETLYQIDSLQGKLERIHTKLQKMRQGSYWARLIRQADDNGEIMRFNEDIKHHLRVFGIQQNLSIHQNLARHDSVQAEHKAALMQMIDNGHKQHMVAIRRTLSADGVDESDAFMITDGSTDEKRTLRRGILTDGPITEEPEDMDIVMDDEMGTIHDGDELNFQHCLPPNPKMHFGHEELVENIAAQIVKHQAEDTSGDPYASYDVTPRPSTPASGAPSIPPSPLPSVASLPGLSSISGLPSPSSPSNPFASLTPTTPRSFSIPYSSPPATPNSQNYLYLPSSPSSPMSSRANSLSLNAPSPSSSMNYLQLLSSNTSRPTTPSYMSAFPSTSSSPVKPSSYFPPMPPSSKSSTSSLFPTPPASPNSFSSLTALTSQQQPNKNPFASLATSPLSLPSSPWPSSSSSAAASTSSFIASLTSPRPTTPRPQRPQGPARLAILGPPGIGKSSIAYRVMHRPPIAELFGDRRICVSCENSKTADEIVEKIISTMGIEDAMRGAEDRTTKLISVLSPNANPNSPTPTSSLSGTDTSSSASSSAYSASCAASSFEDGSPRPAPPTLLVLDGLDKSWMPHDTRYSVENLLNLFAALPQLALIITLRGNERPLGVKWTRPFLQVVQPLKIDDAKQVFSAIADKDGELVKDIVEACDGNPLLITQSGTSAQYESLSSLLSRLQLQKAQREHAESASAVTLTIRPDIANRL